MENENFITMNAYVLSKDNARTFVEFTLKMKNETENGFKSGKEKFYIIDKNNKENNMKFEEHPIGTILVIILNKYNKIKKVLENHKNIIYNAEKEKDVDYEDSLKGLKEDLTNISKALSIFDNFIDRFSVDVYHNYNIELEQIKNQIKACEYFDHKSFKLKAKYIKIDKKLEKLKNDKESLDNYINTLSSEEQCFCQSRNSLYKPLQKQFIYMSTAQCLKDKCISFFDNWLNEFEKMKEIVDNSFVPTDENSRYYTFSGITLQLPSPTIEFSKSKKAKETKYKYELSTLTDFIYASLYHLQLEGLRIIKCPYCENYFIPTRLNQTWCGKEYKTNQYGKITCREYRLVKNSEQISNEKNCMSLDFYKAIYRRLQHNHKEEFEEFTKNYNYKEKKKLLEQSYSSEEVEQELLKWLTKYDKEFFAKFPSKTRKPTSTKYWVE